MECRRVYDHLKPSLFVCSNKEEIVYFDKISKRFTHAELSSGGYTFDQNDTEQIEAGTCQKF